MRQPRICLETLAKTKLQPMRTTDRNENGKGRLSLFLLLGVLIGSIVLITLIVVALQWFAFQSLREQYGLPASKELTERSISGISQLKVPVETK